MRGLLALRCFERQLKVARRGGAQRIAAQTAAAGLHHAHARIGVDGRPLQIVHRDISPSNLIVSFEGNVKLIDFGVAKAADRVSATRAGTVKGKISYLSPEQCRSLPVDRRSDLFGLGIVMWEMLANERLYRRESELANMTAIVTEPPLRPSSLRPEVPPAVDEVVMRLLEKEPGDRYQTAAEVVEAIEDAALKSQVTLSSSARSRGFVARAVRRAARAVDRAARGGAADQRPFSADHTVTSEPVPAELVAALAPSPFRTQQLASVPDLSLRNLPQTGPAPVAAPHMVTLRGFAVADARVTVRIGLVDRGAAASAMMPADAKPRPVWPIVLMIAIAAALGGSAVWLATRGARPAAPAITSSRSRRRRPHHPRRNRRGRGARTARRDRRASDRRAGSRGARARERASPTPRRPRHHRPPCPTRSPRS